MKKRLLNVLACPVCNSEFSFFSLEESETQQGSDNIHRDIHTGILKCNQNHIYPVINHIPRMLNNSLKKHYSDIKHYINKLPAEIQDLIKDQLKVEDSFFKDSFSHTQKSFSSEWEALNSSDRAWGRDIEYRRNFFLDSFDIKLEDLRGKMIFDAGCGHGETLLSISNTGSEIFAMDLSFSVDDIYKRVQKLPDKGTNIHIIQGNAHTPPYKNNIFDLVYSAGVLHHTPDTKKGFQNISNKVKPGGSCFIEVYSNELKNFVEYLVYIFFYIIRVITVNLPHSLLHIICWIGAPFSWLYTNVYKFFTKKTVTQGLH